MRPDVILVTGGQRSGKSDYGERLALELSPEPVYIATCAPRPDDADMAARIAAHKARRGSCWTNFEEPLYPHRLDLRGRVALLDCVTLWLTNHLFRAGDDTRAALEAWTDAYDRLLAESNARTIIFVTNEIGLGGISTNSLQRRFTDIQGLANRRLAADASQAVMLVSGMPLKLK